MNHSWQSIAVSNQGHMTFVGYTTPEQDYFFAVVFTDMFNHFNFSFYSAVVEATVSSLVGAELDPNAPLDLRKVVMRSNTPPICVNSSARNAPR
jgi:hypothetical protein